MSYNLLIEIEFLYIKIPITFVVNGNGKVLSYTNEMKSFSNKTLRFLLGTRYEEFEAKFDFLLYLYNFAVPLAHYDLFKFTNSRITSDIKGCANIPSDLNINSWFNDLLSKRVDYKAEYLVAGWILSKIIDSVKVDSKGWTHIESVIFWDETSPISEPFYLEMLNYIFDISSKVNILCELSRYPDDHILDLVVKEILRSESRNSIENLIISLSAWSKKQVADCLNRNHDAYVENEDCFRWIKGSNHYWIDSFRVSHEIFKLEVIDNDRKLLNSRNPQVSYHFLNRLLAKSPNKIIRCKRLENGNVVGEFQGNDVLNLEAYEYFIQDLVNILLSSADVNQSDACHQLLRTIGYCSDKIPSIIKDVFRFHGEGTELGEIKSALLLCEFYLVTEDKGASKKYIIEVIRRRLSTKEKFDAYSIFCGAIVDTFDHDLFEALSASYLSYLNVDYPLLRPTFRRYQYLEDEKYSWKKYVNHGAGRW